MGGGIGYCHTLVGVNAELLKQNKVRYRLSCTMLALASVSPGRFRRRRTTNIHLQQPKIWGSRHCFHFCYWKKRGGNMLVYAIAASG